MEELLFLKNICCVILLVVKYFNFYLRIVLKRGYLIVFLFEFFFV